MCSISINGVTHLIEQIDYDVRMSEYDEIKDYMYRTVGNPSQDEEMLNENSPALQATKIRTPILLIGSTDDEIVPYAQAKLMNKALNKAKKDVQLITLEDSGHNPFYYRDDKIPVYTEVEKFLRQHLE